MRVISASTLKNYWTHNPFAERPLRVWLADVELADWATPADVKKYSGSVSILKDGRAVFNVSGNHFRVVVHIAYKFRTLFIKFVGTHSEYDEIDAQTVEQKTWR